MPTPLRDTHPNLDSRWLIAVLVVASSLLHAYIASSTTSVELDFLSGRIDSTYVSRLDGWEVTPQGLATAAEFAVLDIDYWKFRWDDLHMRLVTTEQGRGAVKAIVIIGRSSEPPEGYVPPAETPAAWSVEISRDDQTLDISPLVEPNGTVNLSRCWPSGGPCKICVSNVEGKTGPLIESIYLQRRSWRWGWVTLPLLYSAVYLALRHFATCLWPAQVHRILLYGWFGLAVIQVPFSDDMLARADELLLASLMLSLVPTLLRKSVETPVVPVIGCVLALGAMSRFDALFAARFNLLDPDAAGFLQISRSMSWFYDAEHREPLFILLIKLTTWWGDPEFQLRLLTVFLSILLVGVAYVCGREIQGPVAGVVVALLVAGNAGWAWQATRGLRLEAFTICLLVLTALIWTRRDLPRTWHAVGMGVAAALVCLVRVTSVWFCLLGLAYGVFRRGWSLRLFALSAAVALVPLLPSYVYWGGVYGDPFHAANIHIRFYRNLEFMGQPGMPTQEEVAEDSATGPDVTPFEFFFQQHSLFDLTLRTIARTESTFIGDYFREYICEKSNVLAWCIIVSYGVVLLRDRRTLLVWMLMLLGPIAWLYGPSSGPEWRLVFHISVFCYLCAGIGVDELIKSSMRIGHK